MVTKKIIKVIYEESSRFQYGTVALVGNVDGLSISC